jgi:thiol peroxidase
MRPLILGMLTLVACTRSAGKVDEADVVTYLRDQPPAVRAQILEKAAPVPEHPGAIHRGDAPLTIVGDTLEVGAEVPDVALADGKLQPIQLSALRGKTVVLSVVPSLDTRVCEAQTHAVSDAIARMPPGVEVMTVSRDLPFAQTRFAEEAMSKTTMGSDYRTGAFGRAFGLEVKETGLLARSVWVIGPDGKVAYRELVDDQGTEPEYEALIEAVNRVAG